MAGKTDYRENKVLDHVLATAAYTAPSAVYVALFTADPTDTGDTTNEISAGGYARTQATFRAASGGSASNSADVTFPQATADWGTITHFAIMDAATAGNMLYSGALTASKTVTNGDTFKFAAGDLTVTED